MPPGTLDDIYNVVYDDLTQTVAHAGELGYGPAVVRDTIARAERILAWLAEGGVPAEDLQALREEFPAEVPE